MNATPANMQVLTGHLPAVPWLVKSPNVVDASLVTTCRQSGTCNVSATARVYIVAM